MTPINQCLLCTARQLYKSATGIAISNAQYMTLYSAGLVLFIAMGVVLEHWSGFVKMWKWNHWTAWSTSCQISAKTATVLISWESSYYGCYQNCRSGSYRTLRPLLKSGTGMAVFSDIGVIVMAILSFDGKPLLSIQEGLQKGVYWPSMFLVGATLSMGTLVTKPELGVIGLLKVWSYLCICDTISNSCRNHLCPLGRITNECLFKLSNRIGRHNRINDCLCDRLCGCTS